jgi:fructoselysine-6-P-deglycase FrlB-like protein
MLPLLRGIEVKPLLVVGSGGSLSVAHLAASFHERRFGHLVVCLTQMIV